ncbi:MAG: RluA family pseudouridine synthase [Candidatus Omnitrophota bacterium]
MEELRLIVEENAKGTRIDKYLAKRVESLSRSRLQQLIQTGSVFLNSAPIARVSEKVKGGDLIALLLPPPAPSDVEPENIPIDILYEDAYLVVINKQPGISVHPTESMHSGTLVNALLYHIEDLSGIGGVLRPGIVHRLDRGTSGVLIAAKQDDAHRKLSNAFKARRIHKTYWAIVHGTPPQLQGEIDLPIGRSSSDRKQMTIRPDGRNAVTRYKILRAGLGGTLVELYPLTGRTHQIRVHLRHLGCPIVGDVLYGTKKYLGRGELERLLEGYPGIALHAHSIRFEHPATGEIMTITAEPPGPLAAVMDRLK